MGRFYLCSIACLLSVSLLFGQRTTTSGAEGAGERIPANLKFALFPLISGAFSNRLHLGLQHEKAFASNPKFAFTTGLLFSKTSTGTFGGGVRLWTNQHTIFRIRPGLRYYIRRSSEVYRSFFVNLSPYYTYGEFYDQTEFRHGLGVDAMIGYQWVFNRWTVEANYSIGIARTWYEIVEDPWYGPSKGIKNFVSP